MPYRKPFLATGDFYHIFNRSIGEVPIFIEKREAELFLKAALFYLNPHPPTRFSIYIKSKKQRKVDLKNPLVEVIAYCLMPTHFHFILRQMEEEGVRIFLQRLINSYAHYFNLKKNRRGPLFESAFQAVRVGTEEQLLHLSRYIHLNPTTAYLVGHPKDYPFSSYRSYLGEEKNDLVNPEAVISCFSSPKRYEKFVLAQKEYQCELNKIKHLLLER